MNEGTGRVVTPRGEGNRAKSNGSVAYRKVQVTSVGQPLKE